MEENKKRNFLEFCKENIIYMYEAPTEYDFDKINGVLIARNRRPGDKIFINGMHKSLKKLMNEKKIPLNLRSRIPIICDESGILAIPFIGIRDEAAHKQSDISNKFINVNICIR